MTDFIRGFENTWSVSCEILGSLVGFFAPAILLVLPFALVIGGIQLRWAYLERKGRRKRD